jgi:hypothetical protein
MLAVATLGLAVAMVSGKVLMMVSWMRGSSGLDVSWKSMDSAANLKYCNVRPNETYEADITLLRQGRDDVTFRIYETLRPTQSFES